MLDVVIAGVPQGFEADYLSQLRQFESRVRIAGLYDPIPANRADWMQQHRLSCYGGLQCMIDHLAPKAVFLLSNLWQLGDLPRSFQNTERALFLGKQVLSSFLGQQESVHQQWKQTASTIVPELPLRYWPSVIRAQELIATRVGKLQHVEIDSVQPVSDLTACLHWTDLIFHLLRISITKCSLQYDSDLMQLTLEAPEVNGLRRSAQIRSGKTDQASLTLHGANGAIEILDERTIRWRCEHESFEESLSEDRSPQCVMIDHFLRRSAGGLIPVPDWNHICQIHQQLLQLT